MQALAQLTTHIPNKGESAGGGVRYYGFYSNKLRGLRKKARIDDEVPALIDSDISRQAFRKNWARLIQKINLDTKTCSGYPDGYCMLSPIDIQLSRMYISNKKATKLCSISYSIPKPA